MSLRVAVMNAGSSTLKLALIDVTEHGPGEIQRIVRTLDPEEGLAEAARDALGQLEAAPDAFGHRVVHGGEDFVEPTLITDRVVARLEKLAPLAPLHTAHALAGIREAAKAHPGRPAVAVFDTAFHAHRPPESMRYALPREVVDEFGIRRYGFHGIAHASLVGALAEAEGIGVNDVSGVMLQLGAGCSACAVRDGRSIETSMGLTPLEGLVMMTRCGNIDPAIVLQLVRAGYSADRIEEDLTTRSGLYGIGGIGDMRQLLAADADGKPEAKLALDVFCHSIVATVGAYFTLLGGAQALVFGGGIGTNAPQIRARVAERLGAWNVVLDTDLNRRNEQGRISVEGSTPVFALGTDEERVIAREVAGFLGE